MTEAELIAIGKQIPDLPGLLFDNEPFTNERHEQATQAVANILLHGSKFAEAIARLTQERDAARAELLDEQKANALWSKGMESVCEGRDELKHELRTERERREKAERERDARPEQMYSHPCGYTSAGPVCTKHGGTCNRKFEELVAERDAALARVKELEGIMSNIKEKS